MTAPVKPAAAGPPAGPPKLLLAAAVAAGALPLVVLAPDEILGYDAWWHVFIAGQEEWRHFWREIRWNAHPPLFYLLLRGAIAALGSEPAVFRLVPAAAAVASAWLVGRIVARTAANRWLPAAAAFAFGTSLSTVTIGLDVRAYALATLFMLAAFWALLELVERGFGGAHGPRVAFALAASLALLTHYVAAVFLAGCCAAVAVAAAADRDFRRRLLAGGRRRWLSNLLTFAAPFALLAVEYRVHMKMWAGRLSHVPEHLFDPRREGALGFVWRNTRSLFELFVPPLDHRPFASTLMVSEPGLSAPAAAVLVAASLAAVGWLAGAPARRPGDGDRPGASAGRRLPPLMLAAITVLLVALALLGRHPYGGALRHMYVLFPFAVVVLALLVDDLAARTGRRAGRAAVAAFALAGLANAASWIGDFQPVRSSLMQAQMDRFRELFGQPEVVFVDPYNLINLYMHHHDLRWRFVRRIPAHAPVDVWRVGDGEGRGFTLCRDHGEWLLDLSKWLTYRRIRRCLEGTRAERVTVFRPQQKALPNHWPVAGAAELAAVIAPSAQLEVETVVVEGEDVYAAFGRP